MKILKFIRKKREKIVQIKKEKRNQKNMIQKIGKKKKKKMEKEYVEIFSLKESCEFILFSENLNQITTPKEMKTKEFNQKLNIIYSNSIFCEKGIAKEDLFKRMNQKMKLQELEEEIEKELTKEIEKDLIICKMDENVGFGVFANKNFQIGECLLFYNGIIKEKEEEKNGDYQLSYDHHHWWIDSEKIGNVTRFIQHAPSNLKIRSKKNQKEQVTFLFILSFLFFFFYFTIFVLTKK